MIMPALQNPMEERYEGCYIFKEKDNKIKNMTTFLLFNPNKILTKDKRKVKRPIGFKV